VSGAAWAKAGAQRLTFWLNADGEEQGNRLVLRANYRQSDGTTRDESFHRARAAAQHELAPRGDSSVRYRNENGPLLPRLSGVYLLQFVQRGTGIRASSPSINFKSRARVCRWAVPLGWELQRTSGR
jgi:hypothetical protein